MIPHIAIILTDTKKEAYEQLLSAFTEPEVLEVFTPVVYATGAELVRYAKEMQIECRINPVDNASTVMENRINIVDIREDVPKKGLQAALDDYEKGDVDSLVMVPGTERLEQMVADYFAKSVPEDEEQDLSIVTYGNDSLLMASVCGSDVTDVTKVKITSEQVEERVLALRWALRREMRIDNPRVGVLVCGEKPDESPQGTDRSVIVPAILQLKGDGKPVFGPYAANAVMENNLFSHFDGILAITEGQGRQLYERLFAEDAVRMVSGLPILITSSKKSVRSAIYRAIDASRSRFYFDKPYANPLPKLYHERREDGDKARFAVRKKPETAQ